MKKILKLSLSYLVLTLGGFLMILPFFWMISTSLKTAGQTTAIPPIWWPTDPQFGNYETALSMAPFGRYFINSVIVTVLSTLGELITSILAAYAFAKLQFWGKDFIFLVLLGTMMVPGELMTIPNFVTLSGWGMINTYGALIIPWLASVFTVFALKQSFESVPDELYYAAKVDGSSDWRYLWEIMVPLSKSSIIAVMILKVIGSWNSFLWPLIVTTEREMRTLPVGLQSFTTEAGTRFELLMAASAVVVLPMIVFYLIFQKHIIKGISRSGLKG